MQSRPITDYIFFGTRLRFLQDASAGMNINGTGWVLESINRFQEYLDEFNLQVTKRASYELDPFKKKIAQKNHGPQLTISEAAELKEIFRGVRKTLSAEAEGNIAYIITEKRIDVDKLMFDPSSLLKTGAFDKIPSISQIDFIEACKCVAFDLPTASAFHILRCTEGVLRKYYLSTIRKGRIKGFLMWGPMITALKSRRKPFDLPLLNNLLNIKESFRNPTDHPEKIYDIEEVQDLFNQCVDVLNRMCFSTHWDPSIIIRELD